MSDLSKTPFPFVLFEKTNKTSVVVLINGFVCSLTYWRAALDVLLSQSEEVPAIDLLGQANNTKRSQYFEYSISLWAIKTKQSRLSRCNSYHTCDCCCDISYNHSTLN